MSDARRRRPLVTGLMLLLLAVVGAAALWSERPPAPVAADAPPGVFSADRAVRIVDDLARAPHPIGSPESDRVRDDVVARLTALGLATRVEASAGVATGEGQVRAGRVDNVVATLPGTAPTGAVVLMAHHDSVAGGPGAADDAASVAGIVETVRALRAGPELRNDVVVVVTDGEEAGLLGAQAWVRESLLPDRPTLVLNHEARGVVGPSLFFQTSPGNAGIVDTVAAAAPHPRGDSSLVEIYRLLPNDTDLTRVLDAGRPGLNAAFVERPSEYHTPGDTPAALSRASLQNQGANMLALTAAFGDQDLRPLDPLASGLSPLGDAVYFRVLGVFVSYPQSAVWPLALLAAVLGLGAVVVGRVRGLLTLPRVLVAAVSTPVALAVAALLGVGLWELLVVLRPSYADTGAFLGRPALYELADAAIAVLVVLGWWLALRRRVGPTAMVGGVVLVLVALGVATAAVAPGASFLFVVPALGLALGVGVAAVVRRPLPAAGALVLGAVPAVALLAPLGVAVFAVGEVSDGAAVVLFVLLGLPVVALLDAACALAREAPRLGRRAVLLPVGVVLAVVVLAGAGLAVDRPDARQPQSSHLAYVLDADRAAASWVTRDEAPAAWTAGYAAGPATTVDAWPDPDPVATGPAPPLAVPPPTATVLAREPGRIELLVASPRGARTVSVRTNAPLASATVAFPGRTVVTGNFPSVRSGPWPSRVVVDDVPPEGVRLTLRLRDPGPVGVAVDDETTGLDVVPGFVGRPPELRRSPTEDSDLVVLERSYVI